MDVDCGTVGCVFLKEAMFLAMFVGLTVLCEEGTTVCFCLRDQMFKQWEAGHKNSRLDLFWNLFFLHEWWFEDLSDQLYFTKLKFSQVLLSWAQRNNDHVD